jgi:hypothetical protein
MKVKIMKKGLLSLISLICMLLVGSVGLACDFQWSTVNVSATADQFVVGSDYEFVYGGIAGGLQSANSYAGSHAVGFTIIGDIDLNVSATAGALETGNAYTFSPNLEGNANGIGVGHFNEAIGVTGGSVGTDSNGLGFAIGTMHGSTCENTLSFSLMTVDNGMSYGLASQNGEGNFLGSSINLFEYGNSPSTAGVDIQGHSLSESYRFVARDENSVTRGLGNIVETGTNVNSHGRGSVCGNWEVSGNVVSSTHQNTPHGSADASAHGSYYGTGHLNDGLNVNMKGQTGTSVTEIHGYQGSINRSHSSMSSSVSVGGIQ